ncbi:MAG TPA: sigma-70 family RNA polymerase sigma factor [Desulfotomaculum sp.]|nr:sigma-70 family RNA polymerase sigma factor [Desulfotomaculum sp.]
MDEDTLRQLLARAREGDVEARNTLIKDYQGFVCSVVSACCRRPAGVSQIAPTQGLDDELSIGLIAFDEAVTRYEPERGVPFLAFARLVIKSRLANYFRQESRYKGVATGRISEEMAQAEAAAAWAEFCWEEAAQDRAEEIREYEKALGEFGIALEELVRLSPKHRDSRLALMRAAQSIAADKEMFGRLRPGRRLPLREMALKTGLSPKVIEKNRKYLLALAIIFRHPERFIYLNSYVRP